MQPCQVIVTQSFTALIDTEFWLLALLTGSFKIQILGGDAASMLRHCS